MALQFYWYPKCGTCRKAKKWLDDHQIEYEAIHIVDNPPSINEIRDFYQKSGLELKIFQYQRKKYRELGLKDRLKTMDEEEQLTLLASDGMLLKRPIVTDGEKVTVGFKEDVFEQTWGSF